MHRALHAGILALPLVVSLGCSSAPPEPPQPSEPDRTPPPSEFEGLEGFWSREECEALLARSADFEIAADLSVLSADERAALAHLQEVGQIFHGVFERSRHPEAAAVGAHLATYGPRGPDERARLTALSRLYRLFRGPIAYTLENERVPFAPIDPGYEPGRNVYPVGVERSQIEEFLESHADLRGELLAPRSVVRRRTGDNLQSDRATLAAHPWLDALHPALSARLRRDADEDAFYAVPYSLAYAPEMERASRLLQRAAARVRTESDDFADYLEQRARDLLSNDYEAGDAAWVSGRFGRLNAQLGAYETYDDHLFGQKAFFAASILIRNASASSELERAVAQLGRYQEQLPGGPYASVRPSIPIGIYDVVADYGQARGGNTASILPNEAHIVRKYGRTILIRRNVLTNSVRNAAAQSRFRAAVADAHRDDLGPLGNFDRTVWHEVGHYLGPHETEDGRPITEALGGWHNHIEEMKADLVSLWLMPRLEAAGVIDAERVASAYAAGVLRILVTSEPPRTSPYRTMQLMTQNWFFDRGVLTLVDGRLAIAYARLPAAVEALLTEVLRIQRAGDPSGAEAFIERWARWDDDVQGVIGRSLDGVSPRFWLPNYPALRSP